ncbi:peptide deformylase [Jannaschia sp. Os4]|uniref:peptide deformylase n=1 Tax=Jannaschia sp. Os4 TaxID=2807617 RepID=UPI0019392B42|nr:peptide deformylase [Jannaschia sp. Os4]MBM2577220.1 peptide deformylase [Jannaschia sp. Os4]
MTHRPFLMWPDRRLRTSAAPVGEIDDAVRAIWEEMLEAMYAMPGVGLAAPQLGIMRRLAVVDAGDGSGPVRLADPVIVAASEIPSEWDEGSPNLPGVRATITRPRAVTVAYTDHHGMRVRGEFVKLRATSVQHQIDHLDGRMFFDRLSKTKRDMLLRRARKRA